MGETKKEISPGVFEVTRPDGTKLITGKDWGSHIHYGDDFQTIKIEKTSEHIPGKMPPIIKK